MFQVLITVSCVLSWSTRLWLLNYSSSCQFERSDVTMPLSTGYLKPSSFINLLLYLDFFDLWFPGYVYYLKQAMISISALSLGPLLCCQTPSVADICPRLFPWQYSRAKLNLCCVINGVTLTYRVVWVTQQTLHCHVFGHK